MRLLLVAALAGSGWCQPLPAGAKVIEEADVSALAATSRKMVLWMETPRRVENPDEYCGTAVHGNSYWEGPARLSLIDSLKRRVINTVNILDPDGADNFVFPISYRIQLGERPFRYYSTPYPVSGRDAIPKILDLRDMTGEGSPAAFPIFQYEACGLVWSSALGYQRTTDRVVHYRIDEGGPWIQQVFAAKPVRPGVWQFDWAPGHGVDDRVHARVHFDQAKQVFMDESVVFHPTAKW